MVEPSFLAVTSTPSIGPSSLEATVPVSADWAEEGPADTRQMSAGVASSEIVVLRISFSLAVQRILVRDGSLPRMAASPCLWDDHKAGSGAPPGVSGGFVIPAISRAAAG